MTAAPPPRRRRFAPDVRLLLGLVLVGASVAGVLALVAAADERVAVYAAAEALAPGDRVTSGDLVERRVALDGAEDLYVRAGSLPDGGFVVAQAVAAGELVPLSAAGSRDGERATALVLRLAAPVSGVVGPGSLVDVWGVPAGERDAAGLPVVIAAQATIVRVVEDETFLASGRAGASVEVLVPRTRVARLLQAVAGGDALAVVPSGLPLGSR